MKSSAIRFLQHVWDHEGEVMGGRSWARLNRSMGWALSIAITSGMRFARDDFKYIEKAFRFGYWGGNERHMLGERYYAMACAVDRAYGENRTAAIAFEHWKDRPVFIYKDRQCLSGRRLAVGSEVHVFGRIERFHVTSFAKDGQSVGLTAHDANGEVVARLKMTPKMLEESNRGTYKLHAPDFKCGDLVKSKVGFGCMESVGKVVKVNARTVRVKLGEEVHTFEPLQLVKVQSEMG